MNWKITLWDVYPTHAFACTLDSVADELGLSIEDTRTSPSEQLQNFTGDSANLAPLSTEPSQTIPVEIPKVIYTPETLQEFIGLSAKQIEERLKEKSAEAIKQKKAGIPLSHEDKEMTKGGLTMRWNAEKR